jgi:hypothetical protein
MVRMVEPEVALAGAVINVNVVEACRRLAQAHLTRLGLIDIDRRPVQNLETARLMHLDRMGIQISAKRCTS